MRRPLILVAAGAALPLLFLAFRGTAAPARTAVAVPGASRGTAPAEASAALARCAEPVRDRAPARVAVAPLELTVGVEAVGGALPEGLAFDVTVEGPFGAGRELHTLRLVPGDEASVELAAAGRYAVRSAAPGYVCATAWIRLDAAAPEGRVQLLAEPARRQRGRVLTGSGLPVAGALVVATEGSATLPREERTDAAGAFTISVPPARFGVVHGLLVLAKGHPPAQATLAPDGEPVDVVLAAGWTLRGEAVDELARPVAGVRVAWRARTRMPERIRTWLDGRPAVTGDDGRFALQGVLPGSVELFATAPGLAPERSSVVPGEETRRIRFEFLRGHRLAGVARDAGGAPVAGAAIEVSPVDPPGEALRVETDGDGCFEVLGLAPGEVLVAAHADGFAPNGAAVRVPVSAPLELSLSAGAALAGSVLMEEPGGYSVSLLDTNERLAHWASFDEPRFRMEDLVPGVYQVRVDRDGRPSEDVQAVTLVAGETTTLPPAAGAPGAQLLGTVVERYTGRPARGRVHLYLQSPDGRGPSEQVASDELDDEGGFRVRGLAAGRYSLLVDPAECGDERVEDLVLDGVELRDLGTLEVARGAIVQLSVRDRDGAPLAGVHVSVSDGLTLFPRRTDLRGELTLRELSAGSCSATIEVDGISYTARGETQEGRVTELELHLRDHPGGGR
ncbi:MAG: carboxypeptidase-like regulatory domain-containing protein [Planctomycetota bacterium]